MKKIFNFGKVNAQGKKNINLVTIEIELKEKEEGEVFSAVGNVWDSKKTDVIMGGQCLEELSNFKELANDTKFKKILRLWRLYHLNDMHSGTPEQELFINEHTDEIEQTRKEINQSKKYDFRHISRYEATCEVLKKYNLYEVEYKGKPYEYGSSWLFKKIPQEDIKEIKNLLSEA